MKGKRMTHEQRSLLLETYLEKGFAAAKPLAAAYGVHPNYLSLLARNAGKRKPGIVSQIRKSRDQMWQRAIENGSVIA